MPGINGIELCKILRGRIKKEVKIIALTANVLQNEQSDILKHGFDGLLTKPFKEVDLISCLNDNTEISKRLDLTALLAMCLNDQDLLNKSLHSFISETAKDMDILQKLVDQLDKNGLMEMSHKLAGRIGQMGDLPLSFKLRKIEKNLKLSFDVTIVDMEMKSAIVEINSLMEAVKLEIEKTTLNPEKTS